jgi:pantetheine-phosphate adenylyltransferase
MAEQPSATHFGTVTAVIKAVCPGSFDPVTNGHLDVFARAAQHVDELTIAVLVNKRKAGMFTTEERMDMIRECTAHLGNVTVDSFHGLLADFCQDRDIRIIVKGLRAVSDFDYELQMAQANHSLTGVETFFISTNPMYGYLSSSLIKEIATFGGDVSAMVPESVHRHVVARVAEAR